MGPYPTGHGRGLHPLPGARAATDLRSVPRPALAQSRRAFAPSPATPSREQTSLQPRGPAARPREGDTVPDRLVQLCCRQSPSSQDPRPREWMGREAAAPPTPGHRDRTRWVTPGCCWPGPLVGGRPPRTPGGVKQALRVQEYPEPSDICAAGSGTVVPTCALGVAGSRALRDPAVEGSTAWGAWEYTAPGHCRS